MSTKYLLSVKNNGDTKTNKKSWHDKARASKSRISNLQILKAFPFQKVKYFVFFFLAHGKLWLFRSGSHPIRQLSDAAWRSTSSSCTRSKNFEAQNQMQNNSGSMKILWCFFVSCKNNVTKSRSKWLWKAPWHSKLRQTELQFSASLTTHERAGVILSRKMVPKWRRVARRSWKAFDLGVEYCIAS